MFTSTSTDWIYIMAHMLETHGSEATFASLRTPAWHGLGYVSDVEMTTEGIMRHAHLSNWNVRLEDVDLPGRSHKNYFAVTRTNPFDGEADVLGLVGERYKVVQNEELFSFADNILDGARWETAGSIKNGTVVFGSLALDREIVLDPNGVNDKVNTYLLVHTSHDGSLSVQASVTPVRVVCQNTLNAALAGVKQSYKIRHTQTVDGKVAAAREALGLAHKYLDEFDVQAQALMAAQVNDEKFFEIITTAYPKPEKDAKGSFTKWENKIDMLNDIYRGDTNHMIAGTAWGAYNAMTERLDWFRTSRGGNQENTFAAASGFDAATNAEKNRLLSIVKTLAMV